MKKVIVQDTNADLLETMTIILEDAGYKVVALRQYKDVFPKIENFQPHLILLDFRLSGEDAVSTCKEIKKTYPDLAVLAMSCSVFIEQEYLQAGFDDFIAKPFDIDHLFTVLKRYSSPS